MPIRSYTNVDLILVSDITNVNSNSTIIGTKFNRTIAGSTAAPGTVQLDQTVTVNIDYTAFPSIPVNAVISKVEISWTIVGNTSGSHQVDGYFLAARLIGGPGPAYIILGGQSALSDDPVPVNEVKNYTDNTSQTRAELIANYGTLVAQLSTLAKNLVGGIGLSTALTTSIFTLDVTYVDGPFSWWIKPTEKIINGGRIKIIEDPGDILAVADDDDPPPGYVFYGSDDDFPSGPVDVWWISNDFFQFFIFSPIDPSVLGFSTWTNFGASPPTCSACLTLTLGVLTILIANASGIYTLQDAKTNDTLYLRATSETIDFKIPNPFAKTGLVP